MLGLVRRAASNDQFWIGSQLLLFGYSAVTGIRALRRGASDRRATRMLGLIPVGTAVAVAELARRELGKNITIAPTPVRGGHLVDTGIYGVVRHPMYLAATLALLGWAILSGARAALPAVPAALAFFNAKARHEESLLARQYDGYDAYRRRVPGRLLPRSTGRREA